MYCLYHNQLWVTQLYKIESITEFAEEESVLYVRRTRMNGEYQRVRFPSINKREKNCKCEKYCTIPCCAVHRVYGVKYNMVITVC